MFIKLPLHKRYFTEKETTLVELGDMRATAFRYTTGVCGLRVFNKNGYVEMLPFQGQQIWRMNFLNHELTMKTMFDEPRPTTDFLSTYGGFLLHCGLTAIGVPGADDTHPLHGELPNAPYSDAWLITGTDDNGEYISVCGRYRFTVGFEKDYTFSPEMRLYRDKTTVELNVDISNLRSDPLEYAYLCHINFRPEDGSRLLATTKFDKDHVYTHWIIPDGLDAEKAARLNAYFDKLDEDIAVQNRVDGKTQVYDPEIVFTIKFIPDENGYAHSMQYLPDGYAHYVRHNLPMGLRWISRTGDEDALGLVLPSTGEHRGYNYMKSKGQMRYLAPKSGVGYSMEIGILSPDNAEKTSSLIESIATR